MMGIRTGAEYIENLRRRPRDVWLRGERVDDVTAHPVLRRPIQQIAAIYDMQHDPALRDRLVVTNTAGPSSRVFSAPHSSAELAARGEMYQLYAERSFGLLGRAPDFLNTALMAFAQAPEVFSRRGSRYADNLAHYFRHVRDHDLFLTHALITPQIDRSKSSAQQRDHYLHMGVVAETSEGLVVRGARMLATMAPMADEIFIYGQPGLRPGDDRHAVCFALPIDAPGLRLICREPFTDGSRNTFDHTLATHFEEADCLVVFDDVLVPWERVFLHGSVEAANALYTETPFREHAGHQGGVRGLVKMRFITGVAMRLCQAVGIDGFLHVQQKLGEAIAATEICRGLLTAAVADCRRDSNGTVRPAWEPLQALRMHLSAAYPKLAEVLQVLGAGGLLGMPSSFDLISPIAPDIARYYRGAGDMEAVDRIRLFKLAWDLCGDGFGQRAVQYERYYAGDPVRVAAGAYLGYDKSECFALVDRALDLAGEPAAATVGNDAGAAMAVRS